jgi:hypothetical protein
VVASALILDSIYGILFTQIRGLLKSRDCSASAIQVQYPRQGFRVFKESTREIVDAMRKDLQPSIDELLIRLVVRKSI